jgi:DNA-binding response OmpR family regulator
MVLLDAVMPGMSGFEICRSIRGNPETAELPVIFLTASAERETVIQAIQSGADDYTLKRSDLQVLVGKVHRILSAVGRPDENPGFGAPEGRFR